MQYVDSKLPNAPFSRAHKSTGASSQVLQQYFANQQLKYETRSTRNVLIFDDKLTHVCSILHLPHLILSFSSLPS